MENMHLDYLSKIEKLIEKNFEKLMDSQSKYGGVHISIFYQAPSDYQKSHHEIRVNLDSRSESFNLVIPNGCPDCGKSRYKMEKVNDILTRRLICKICSVEFDDICLIMVKEILESELMNNGINIYYSNSEFLSKIEEYEHENL